WRTRNGLDHDRIVLFQVDRDPDAEEEPLRILLKLIEGPRIHKARVPIAQSVQHAPRCRKVQLLGIRPWRGAALSRRLNKRGNALPPAGALSNPTGLENPRTAGTRGL